MTTHTRQSIASSSRGISKLQRDARTTSRSGFHALTDTIRGGLADQVSNLLGAQNSTLQAVHKLPSRISSYESPATTYPRSDFQNDPKTPSYSAQVAVQTCHDGLIDPGIDDVDPNLPNLPIGTATPEKSLPATILVPDPPNLEEWRDRFFDIEQPLMLTEEQYTTYFPHVDNVYSHRSTQKYKRKPFISHYWDCRLKGRPTGTPMNKPKYTLDEAVQQRRRKRSVRERDLCDVKIKVTEFYSQTELNNLGLSGVAGKSSHAEDLSQGEFSFVVEDGVSMSSPAARQAHFGVLAPNSSFPAGHPGTGGKKWYLVQRVNTLGAAGDGQEKNMNHKHTLEDSDRIKKNSVQRWILAQNKVKKKISKADETYHATNTDGDDGNNGDFNMVDTEMDAAPPETRIARFHASGLALQTLQARSQSTPSGFTFFGNSFCPFAQRIWIALELIGLPYRYVECTEYNMTSSAIGGSRCDIPELLEVDPEGHIPCLRHNNFGLWESAVVLEYLEDLAMGHSLFLPAMGDPQLKAHSRLWASFIERRILPMFYVLLATIGESDVTPAPGTKSNMSELANTVNSTTSQDPVSAESAKASRQIYITNLAANITTLVNASHRTGPFFLGTTISYVDIMLAPWIIRLDKVLEPHHPAFTRFGSELGVRWQMWVNAVEKNDAVARTCSESEDYWGIYKNAGGELDGKARNFAEAKYARKVLAEEGFGLGGDIWGPLGRDV